MEELDKDHFLQVGQQSVRRLPLFGMDGLKLNRAASNHSDSNTSRGLQPVSQWRVSSRSFAFDANRTTLFWHHLSNRTWLHMRIGFKQLKISLHRSTRSGDIASWALLAVLLIVAVLACVCVGGKDIRSIASPVSGTCKPLGEASSGSLRQPHISRRSSTFRETNTARPPTAHVLPTARAPPSVGPTSVLSLPASAEALDFLCPQLVVPQNSESAIHIPISNSMNSFQVVDVEGNPVLSIERQVGKTILLAQEFILAQCLATPVHGRASEIQLLRNNGEHFAKLVQSGPEELTNCPNHEDFLVTWTIQTHAGVAWFLLGHCDSSTIEVRDKLGSVVATAQQIQKTGTRNQPGDVDKAYLLRIASLMDVSIAIFGILAVNHLL